MTCRTSWLLISIWIPSLLGGSVGAAEPATPASSADAIIAEPPRPAPQSGLAAEPPWSVAERLLRSAQQNQLSETQAAEAAALAAARAPVRPRNGRVGPGDESGPREQRPGAGLAEREEARLVPGVVQPGGRGAAGV